LRGYADRLEGDPERLAFLDERLALIRRLLRKHGGALDEVIAKTVELRTELESLTGRDARLAEVTAARTRAESAAMLAASTLGASRKKAARRLEKEVGAALAELGMSSARLSIAIEPRALGPTGTDRIELMLASNRGEDARPLARIASGGELARFALALKVALAEASPPAVLVFDEVDRGVGGAVADAVGERLQRLSRSTQVLLVTHAPQVAARAERHFCIVRKRDRTEVQLLSDAERVEEIARMLSGAAVTEEARAAARRLLMEAQRPQKQRKRA
jgi:DNA repair protein RecN (Recombination protein N)